MVLSWSVLKRFVVVGLVAALNTGAVADKVDNSRRVVSGRSMGGGGTLIAAKNNLSLKAAVGLPPWSSDKSFSNDRVPSAMIGGSSDTIAQPSSHATTLYNSIPTSTKKLLGIIRGADHFFPGNNPANQPASKYQTAWVKRFADNDTRYSQFLVTDSRLSRFASNGPF
jgi:triacylglycerol lipase